MPVVLALDPGERRTGIAISDPEGLLASPVQTHDRRSDGSLIELLRDLCRERSVERILVGHALTADGSRAESARRGEQLAQKIGKALGIPVELVDERYSSQEADHLLKGSGRPKGDRDQVAAAYLLQGWLDGRREA